MNKFIKMANSEPMSKIKGGKTGREFSVTDYMYGCLGPVEGSPLSAISITGNSISIDIWTGCALQCAYCHVQGVKQDLDCSGKMRKKPIRRTHYNIDQILTSLIEHPLFEKNVGIISICTSSTEPFFSSDVIESTLEIMEWFKKRNLKNPFWIVTKVGIPEECIDRLKKISKNNKIIISICWANNNRKIEPYAKNRFTNIKQFKNNTDIFFNWYLRPLVKDWSDDFEHLEQMFIDISSEYGSQITSIIPGGLRWTEGIEYGMTEVRNLELPKNVSSASRHSKTLTSNDFIRICELARKYFPNTPVYKHSSCAVSSILDMSNISLTNYFSPKDCILSKCSPEQRDKCNKSNVFSLEKINWHLSKRGIDISVKDLCLDDPDNLIISTPKFNSFSPSIKQQIVTIIARLMEYES